MSSDSCRLAFNKWQKMSDNVPKEKVADNSSDSEEEEEEEEDISPSTVSSYTIPLGSLMTLEPQWFTRLSSLTDLNAPPSNWLRATPFEHLSGFATSSQRSCFTSFRMAAHNIEQLHKAGVDVVSGAENIKRLLKLPLANNSLSLIVHKIRGTLLIDYLDIHRLLLKPLPEWAWLREFFLKTVEGSNKHVVVQKKSRKHDAIQERNLVSKFLHYSLGEDEDKYKRMVVQHVTNSPMLYHVYLPPLPEPEPVEADPQEATDFARTLLWNFEDIRMLIGSDMPIFGDADHPSVSLRLHNMKKPINILTGMDYWLDNLMCQVPEVLMCYHLDGIVQKYELIKTEDLPQLSEESEFSPGVIRDVAKNILYFLKRNATKEGHTYWLFKAKDDDVVKLYDLTSLCDEAKDSQAQQSSSAGQPAAAPAHDEPEGAAAAATAAADAAGGVEDDNNITNEAKNPFRTAVAMLMYKVARNVIHEKRERESSTVSTQKEDMASGRKKRRDRERQSDRKGGGGKNSSLSGEEVFLRDQVDEEATARQLLENCIALIDKDKYPQIATSAAYMLSDLYIPDTLDPALPQFDMSAPGSVKGRGGPAEKKEGASSFVAVGLDELKSSKPSRPPEHSGSSAARPLPKNVIERCNAAMGHVEEGLRFLQLLVQKRDEADEKQRKAREQHERDNPTMGQPMHPIPMPYQDGANDKVAVMGPKSSINAKTSSWYDHLKYVLLKKAFLVYVTLAETHFVADMFGRSLRCAKRALNCHYAAEELTFEKAQSSMLAFIHGVAADSYVQLVNHWDKIVTYQEEYNEQLSSADEAVMEAVEAIVDEYEREWVIKLPEDVEESFYLSLLFFEAALECSAAGDSEESDVPSLKGRRANALNMSASFYINQAASCVKSNEFTMEHVAELAKMACTMLDEGLVIFNSLGNEINEALLLNNKAMAYRVSGEAYKATHPPEMVPDEYKMYVKAIGFYERSLAILNRKRPKKLNQMVGAQIKSITETTNFNLFQLLYDTASNLRERVSKNMTYLEKNAISNDVVSHLKQALEIADLNCRDVEKLKVYRLKCASAFYTTGCYAMTSFMMANKELAINLRRQTEKTFLQSLALFNAAIQSKECLVVRCHFAMVKETVLKDYSLTTGQAKKVYLEVLKVYIDCLTHLRMLQEKLDGKTFDYQEGDVRAKLLGEVAVKLREKLIGEGVDMLNSHDQIQAREEVNASMFCFSKTPFNALFLMLFQIKSTLLSANKFSNRQSSNSKDKNRQDWLKQMYLKSLKVSQKSSDLMQDIIDLCTELSQHHNQLFVK